MISDINLDIDESNWIADSKFEPRRANINLIQRDRLLNKLNESLSGKLVLVTAPAGFGKSTLLFQWYEHIRSQDIKCGWLSLDQNDGDKHQFLAYIIVALERAGVDIGKLGVGAQNGFSDTPIRLVFRSLINLLRTVSGRCVLILDDYHFVTSEVVDSLLEQLIAEIPENITVVVNSRTTPSLGTAILVASGHAFNIGSEELRLTLHETELIIGDLLDEAATKDIFDQTEGWPVAVQLAKAQKKSQPNLTLKISSADGLVASYLTDQVLSTLDEEVREFLLAVAQLDMFNPALADAVTGRNDSPDIIDKLQPLTALIIPLDLDGDWYRLHHLFADYLKEKTARENSDSIKMIAIRASDWHSKYGNLIEAVRYASLIEDFNRCEELILEAGGWKIILYDGIGVLRGLFRMIPQHIVSGSPRLLVARAYLHAKDGEQQAARGLLDLSEGMCDRNEDQFFDRDHMVVEAMINAYEDRREWALNYEKVEKRNGILASMDPIEIGILKTEEVLIHIALGNLIVGASVLQKTFGYMRESNSVLGLNYCYLHAGVIAIYRADFDVAKANINRALELAENNFGSDSGLKHMAQVLHLALKVWSGQGDRKSIDQFLSILSYLEEADGWIDIYLIGLDAAFHLTEQYKEYELGLDIASRFLDLAKVKRLDRLEIFSLALKMKALSYLGRKTTALEIERYLNDWISNNIDKGNSRNWQCLFVTISSLAILEKQDVKKYFNSIERAIDLANKMEANFHLVRLKTVESAMHRKFGDNAKSSMQILEALKITSRDRMMGPFLCNDLTRQTLKDTRDKLRSKEDEILLIDFISDILNRADDMRPKSQNYILSLREQDILEKLATGQSNKEIAIISELTENTVKFHLRNIFAKLSVNKRTQAVAEAHRLKLID